MDVMSTTSPEVPLSPPIRSSTPHSTCQATKEELREDGLKVVEDCPICLDEGFMVRIGCHPSSLLSAAQGKFLRLHYIHMSPRCIYNKTDPKTVQEKVLAVKLF